MASAPFDCASRIATAVRQRAKACASCVSVASDIARPNSSIPLRHSVDVASAATDLTTSTKLS